jgi:putative PIN family toxin of toxin-antitoxin system
VVLDHNVVISAVNFGGGKPRRVLDLALAGEVGLVTSERLLDELGDRLRYRFGWPSDAWRALRIEIESAAALVEPARIAPVCRDPDDDLVLATAVEGRARWIMSGDKDLLVIGSYCGIEILDPARFLELL